MRKPKNNNLNTSGRGAYISSSIMTTCSLSLLLLGFLAINPATTAAYAEEVPNAPAVQSEAISSSVNFSFSDPTGITSLTPTSQDGAVAQYTVRATIDVENSGGYTVYLGGKTANLVGKQTGAIIPAVTAQTNYENMPINSWGYNASEGTTGGAVFQAIPINNRGTVIASNNSVNIKSDRKTLTLSFATHVGIDKPADVYENEITLSVISSPLEVTSQMLYDFGITKMQDMTPTICANAPIGATAQLSDTRNGSSKTYWITKLADNNCWMTQNLDLDVVNELHSANTDSDWNWNANSTYKPTNTQTTVTSSTINTSSTGTYSWDHGVYVIANPGTNSNCGSGKSGTSACPSQFIAVGSRVPSPDPDFYLRSKYTGLSGGSCTKTANSPVSTATSGECAQYDAHYTVGNHYQWNAATVGVGGTITSGQASFSICPKNWKLPTSNSNASGSFSTLIASGEIGNDLAKLTSAPYFFVRGGYVQPDSELYTYAGSEGLYWSSTPLSSNAYAYDLYFGGSSNLSASNDTPRRYGLSVRCLAR